MFYTVQKGGTQSQVKKYFKIIPLFCFLFLMLCLGKTDTVKAATLIEESHWRASDAPVRPITEDYLVRGIIHIEGGEVTVYGAGANHTFLNVTIPDSDGKQCPVFVVEEGATLILNNVTIAGNNVPCENSSCIVVKNGGKVIIQNDVTIEGSGLCNNTNGHGYGGHGIYGDPGSKIEMTDGKIQYCAGYGIGSYGNVTFSGGTIKGCRIGIDANGSGTSITMTGGSLYGNTLYGLNTIDGTIKMTDGTIYNNGMSGALNPGAGIHALRGTVEVTGGEIRNHGKCGIETTQSNVFIKDYIKIHDNGENAVRALDGGGVHEVHIEGGEFYNNNSGAFFIEKHNTWVLNGSIHGNQAGFSIIGGKFYGNFLDIRNNRSDAISAVDVSDFKIYNGYVHDNGKGISLNNCTSVINSGYIYSNSTGITATNGTLSIYGGEISAYNDAVYQHGGTINMHGGSIQSSVNGIDADGATVNMYGGEVKNHRDSGVYGRNGTTLNINGGSIYGNNNNIVNENTCNVNDGNIYNGRSNGILNSGMLTINGGEIHNNTYNGILNTGNGRIRWNGGVIYGNACDVWHDGQEYDNGLVVESNANNAVRAKVYLSSQNRYITAPNTHAFEVVIPSECYNRGKWLIHTNSDDNARNACSNLSFSDKAINKTDCYTKRQTGSNVVVWDRYQVHTVRMEYDIAPVVNNTSGVWNGIGNDIYENVWGGDKYTVPFGNTPTGFTQYATTVVNPRAQMPSEGARVTDYQIESWTAHTFYACFFPQRFVITYYGNGSTGGNIYTQIKYYNVPCSILENRFGKDGYDFRGWRTSSDGSIAYRPGDIYYSNNNMDLYVYWLPKVCTVTFNTNRPTNPWSCYAPTCDESSRNIHYGSKYGSYAIDDNLTNPSRPQIRDVDKTLPTPSLIGYRFDGWYTQPSGGDRIYDNSIYYVNGNSTIYAHWTDITAPGSEESGNIIIKSVTENWVNYDVLVTTYAKDSGSGVKTITDINTEKNGIMQTINNISATQTYSQTTEKATLFYTETRDGVYKYHAIANDYIGNTSQTTRDAYVRIDKTAPVVNKIILGYNKKTGISGLTISNINDNGSGLSDNYVSKINHIWVEVHPGTDPNSAEYTSYDIVNDANGITGNNTYQFKFNDMCAEGIYNIYPNEEKITIVVKATDVAGNMSTISSNANYDGDGSDPNSPWLYEKTVDNCYLYAWIDRAIGNNGDEASGTPNSFRQGEMGKLHIYVTGNMQHVKIDFPVEFEEGLLTQQTLNVPFNTDGTANLNYSDDIANRVLSKEFDITPMLREKLGYDKLYKGSTNEYVPYDGSKGFSFNVAHGGDEGYDFYIPMDMDKNTQHPFTNGQHFNVTVTATKGSIVKTAAPELIVNDNIQFHIQTRIRDPKSPINDEIFQKDVAEGNRLF